MKNWKLFFIAVAAWIVVVFVYELFLGFAHPLPGPMSQRQVQDTVVCRGFDRVHWCTFQEKLDDMTSVYWLVTIFLLPLVAFTEGGFGDIRAFFFVIILTPYIAIPLYWLVLHRIQVWQRRV